MKRRVLSLLLAASLVVTSFSAAAFAQDEADSAVDMIENTEDSISESGSDVIAPSDGLGAVEEELEIGDLENTETGEGEGEEGEEGEKGDPEPEPVYHVKYRGHVQTYGWQNPVYDGDMAGTSGQSKRVEAIEVEIVKEVSDGNGNSKMEKVEGAISYQAHVQTYGWMGTVADGAMAGTSGQSKRVEAFNMKLNGELADKYDLYYCVHAQRYGWLAWAKNGQNAGTAGYAFRLEGIRIQLVEKGGEAPAPLSSAVKAFYDKDDKGVVTYQSHVQTYGWMEAVGDGEVCGTSGESKRMEALKIWLKDPKDKEGNPLTGSIEYRVHAQTHGWMGWVKDGALAGTSGQSKRLEAIEIKLTGEIADHYDIYYRVHAQTFGTLGWAKNGETAGTTGCGKRLENIEIKLVEKGTGEETGGSYADATRIGELVGSFYSDSVGAWSSDLTGSDITMGTTGIAQSVESIKLGVDTSGSLYKGGISYKVLTSDGWSAASADEVEAGVAGGGKMIEAVQISLTGQLATFCDVYYRAYCQKRGWMGWAKNGASAGTQGYGHRLESLEVTILMKGASAPGSTSGAFDKYNEKYNTMTSRVQGMSSGTKYLIAVDCGNNICGVYTGSKGNWSLLYGWTCTTGAASTPTCKGQYSIIYKKPYFGDTYTAWYASFFEPNGYAFHSVLYLPGSKTQFRDPRLGMSLSHGCVRLAIENAQWIYNNCGNGTRVYTYK